MMLGGTQMLPAQQPLQVVMSQPEPAPPPEPLSTHDPMMHCAWLLHVTQRWPFTPHASTRVPVRQRSSTSQHPEHIAEQGMYGVQDT
jgi:hypothetical protein